MTCEKALELLNDHVDGSLTEAEHQEMELHLASCVPCRGEERSLRAFLAEAATHRRESPPPRDLWPGIAERIERERRVLPFLRPGSPVRRYLPVGLAAAAAAAIAIVSTLNVGPGAVGPEPAPAGTLHPAAAGTSDIEQAEGDYIRATNQLLSVLNARKNSMSPETQKSLNENLGQIDGALRQVKDALEKDPGNTRLTKMLASTHQKKLDLLLRLIRLSSRI